MGETWTKAAVSKLRKKAFKKDKEIDEVWDTYTHYPLHIGAQAIGSLSY
ncbi:hypothetical protein [Criblamydia sequanensis]|nr:hypothetical protein [Criblamydia sequanensis]